MKPGLPLAIAAALLLVRASIAPAEEAPPNSPPAVVAPADSTDQPGPHFHKTHRLKYGAIGAVAGVALGAIVAYANDTGNRSDNGGLYYIFYIPLGFVVGTIAGVTIGGLVGGPRPAPASALDLGQPSAAPVSLRIAATVIF